MTSLVCLKTRNGSDTVALVSETDGNRNRGGTVISDA